jgi:hypothetical protein
MTSFSGRFIDFFHNQLISRDGEDFYGRADWDRRLLFCGDRRPNDIVNLHFAMMEQIDLRYEQTFLMNHLIDIRIDEVAPHVFVDQRSEATQGRHRDHEEDNQFYPPTGTSGISGENQERRSEPAANQMLTRSVPTASITRAHNED